MRTGINFAGQEHLIPAFLMQAIISAGQEAGRQAAEDELAQASAAVEADDFVEELTNEPLGYNLVSRHEVLDIALYARESSSATLLLVEGMVIQFPDERPELTFGRFVGLEDYEAIYAIIDAAYPNVEEGAPKDTKAFMGAYRKGLDGVARLWVIFDLNMTREELGDAYEDWVNDIAEDAQAIAFADTREDLPKTL